MEWIVGDTRDTNRWAWNDPIGEEAENNAWMAYFYLRDSMTLEALCGILGNMSAESHINPLQEQVFDPPVPPVQYRGLGLIQWTPPTSLTDLYGNNPTGDNECQLVLDEITGVVSGRFFPSVQHPEYSYTGAQYLALTDEVEASKAYFWERERGTWSDLRATWATHWKDILSGEPPVPPTPERRGMPLYFYMGKRFKRKKGLIL